MAQGVSGTGKSTLGAALADALCLPFVDGDDLHPPSNIAKMSRGTPLTDDDRRPWLDSIRNTAVGRIQAAIEGGPLSDHKAGIIVACSALKKSYREILRGRDPSPSGPVDQAELAVSTYFVFLKGDKDSLMERMQQRTGHFMKVQMLESQLATLECPYGEPGVVTVPIEWSTEEQVQYVMRNLGHVYYTSDVV